MKHNVWKAGRQEGRKGKEGNFVEENCVHRESRTFDQGKHGERFSERPPALQALSLRHIANHSMPAPDIFAKLRPNKIKSVIQHEYNYLAPKRPGYPISIGELRVIGRVQQIIHKNNISGVISLRIACMVPETKFTHHCQY